MNIVQSAIIGVVEGITEYLPVSSTAHIILTQKLLGIAPDTEKEKNIADAYAVCIQLGAILAVLGLYRRRFVKIIRGIFGKDKEGLSLLVNLIIAFVPAVVLGLIFDDIIKHYLFNMWPIVIAWIIGGAVILGLNSKTDPKLNKGKELEEMTKGDALKIGLIQCVAMWPGVSRSLSTILGGIFTGLSVAASVEFSFLLGVITLGGATLYDGYKYAGDIFVNYGITSPVIGLIVAFVSAVAAIKWLVNFLNNHGLKVFGWYRIAIGIVVALLIIFNIPADAWKSVF
ncbi:MAG: undecaprenyl-diphosphate phosphatase [Armatimonadetes bacterium]|nr:undecaprenyl-diphosphate phosphatase [Candidatus Hippobium faecium]